MAHTISTPPASSSRRTLAFDERTAREALARYERVVRAIARRLVPAAIGSRALDFEDLCAEGRVAVLEALQTYGGFGIEERTWVRTRIRQRMIDAVRRVDLRSREELRLMNRSANGELQGEAHERGRLIASRRLVSLESRRGDGEPLGSRLAAEGAPTVEDLVGRLEQRERLQEAMQQLPERQRQALELGLFGGLQLKTIGERMGISESRVCQLQKRAVQRLQALLAEQDVADAA